MVVCCGVLAWDYGFSPRGCAQDYMGANAVLQLAQQQRAKSPAQTNADQAQFRADLQAFSRNSTNLTPDDAARQWLDLVDRAAKVLPQAEQDANPSFQAISGADLVGALPPPADWDALARQIAARPAAKGGDELKEIGLGVLAATLTGDVQKRNLELTNLKLMASNSDDPNVYFYNQMLQQFNQAVLATSYDPDVILKSLQNQIDAASAQPGGQLQMPNLVSEVGPEKAEAFLRKALVLPNVELQFTEPNETSRRAGKLALELIDQLKAPQWSLVNSLDSVDLFEAMDKRFGNTNSTAATPGFMGFDSGQEDIARIYYMLGLISQGRTQEAVAAAKTYKGFQNVYAFESAFDAMDSAGYADQLDDFLHELLSQNPVLPFWSQYVKYSAKAGTTGRMLDLVRSTLARNDLSDSRKAALRQILYTALLASDNVEEGVAEMRLLIASNTPAPAGEQSENPGELGVSLARIGVLTTNAAWTDEGIRAATNWLASPAAQNPSDWEAGDVVSSISQILQELGRGPEAEAILANQLGTVPHPSNAGYGNPPQQILSTLAMLYYKAGRYDDVLTLMQSAPDWGVGDLSDLFNLDPWDASLMLMSSHNGSSSLPLPYVVADCLRARGRINEARRITDALLVLEPSKDCGYELLIAMDGTNAIPRLDQLFQYDQFQTRPLIWKAYLLEQEGRLEEAETTVRQAIAIDPSDGESGRGDRMRAYAELADIRAARGDQKEADFYRQIVKAIRISEDADLYYEAGLLKHAIAMYQEGLDHFADAYCIQSRMAIQLAAMGKTAEAEEHYRRAYELMPDSFGRVESHCFGCEQVFAGERAQSVAEKVFKVLVADRPRKPQVYYLLGYLYTEENRYTEAWTNFQTAVRLDPDYLNAWGKMQEISRAIPVPPQQRDEIVFNLLRLDPLQRHTTPSFDEITDVRRLWDAVAVASQLQPPASTNLFELTASKIALQNKASAAGTSMPMPISPDQENQNQNLSPGQAIAQTPFAALAGQLILSSVSLNQ